MCIGQRRADREKDRWEGGMNEGREEEAMKSDRRRARKKREAKWKRGRKFG